MLGLRVNNVLPAQVDHICTIANVLKYVQQIIHLETPLRIHARMLAKTVNYSFQILVNAGINAKTHTSISCKIDAWINAHKEPFQIKSTPNVKDVPQNVAFALDYSHHNAPNAVLDIIFIKLHA